MDFLTGSLRWPFYDGTCTGLIYREDPQFDFGKETLLMCFSRHNLTAANQCHSTTEFSKYKHKKLRFLDIDNRNNTYSQFNHSNIQIASINGLIEHLMKKITKKLQIRFLQ